MKAFDAILAGLIFPMLCGFILVVMRSLAAKKKPTLDIAHDIALDLIFLATGAAGGISTNAALHQRYPNSGGAIVCLIAGYILLGGTLMLQRKVGGPITRSIACLNILLGTLTVVAVGGVFYLSA
jgi:hypothetical protein